MTFIDYIVKYAKKESGASTIYKCKITGLSFTWEDSDLHFQYLIKNNLI